MRTACVGLCISLIPALFLLLNGADARAGVRRSDREVLIIAHRGVDKFAPENTLAAYRKAVEMKLDYIEIDVRTTKDGRFVIVHNSTVDGKTNGTGNVADLTAEQIRTLDAGSRFGPEFAGEKVPFLEEVLELAKGKIDIYLDLKEAPVDKLVEVIRRHDMQNHIVVYGGYRDLKRIQQICPELNVMPEGSTAARVDRVIEALHPRVVAFTWRGFTKECVDKCHAAGAKVFLDTLGDGDNEAGMTHAIECGVDGIQTDHPDLLLKLLEKRARMKTHPVALE